MPEAKKHDPVVYHKLEQHGRGAVGSVDRIMDLQSGRIMAVKIISVQGSEKDWKEQAREEVELIARLSHVGLSFLSYLGYLLTVINSPTLLTLSIPKVGKWDPLFKSSCPSPTVP